MSGRRISVVVDERGVSKVANSLNRLNTIGNKTAGVLSRVMSGVKGIGNWMYRYRYRIAIGISAMFGAIFKTYSSLETTLKRTQIAMGDFAGESIPLLETLANQLGRDTLYSATDAAEGMLLLAKSGMEVNEILAATPGILRSAIIEDLDLASATDMVTTALVAFELGADQSGRVADVLAKGANLSKTTMVELGQAVEKAGSLAHVAGYSFEQYIAILDAIAKYSGIRGSEAGTHLRMAMTTFSDIGTGKISADGARAFERIGINVEKLGQRIRAGEVDFVKFAGLLHEAGAGVADFGQILEKRTIAAVIGLGKAASEAYPEFVNQLMNAVGYAEQGGAILEDSIEGQTKQIRSSLETMTNAIGKTLRPSLVEFLRDDLRPWINEVTETWENGGDTWQEKLRSVWTNKLKPEFVTMLEGINKLIVDWTPKIAETMGTLASEMAVPLARGLLAGAWNLTKTAWSGWSALGDRMNAHVVGFFTKTLPGAVTGAGKAVANAFIQDLNALTGVNISPLAGKSAPDHAGLGTYGTLAGLGVLPSGWTPSLTPQAGQNAGGQALDRKDFLGRSDQMEFHSASEMVDMFSREFGPSEQLEALREIVDNTEETATSGGSSSTWLSGLIEKMGLSDPLTSILGPIGDTLLSYVTDPIVNALDKHLAPTTTRLQKLADRVLRVFDVPLGRLNMALDGILMLLGQDYTSGRLTNEGAYQYAYASGGGGNVSARSSLHVDQINIHGVKDGEDAAHRTTREIAQYEGMSSRQQARSLRRGMVKQEAQER